MSSSNASLINDEKWMCPLHEGKFLHFLHINPNSKIHKICSDCKHENKILDNEILSITEILESKEDAFFTTLLYIRDETTRKDLKFLQTLSNEAFSQHQLVEFPLTTGIY